jgi:hypothetical protein
MDAESKAPGRTLLTSACVLLVALLAWGGYVLSQQVRLRAAIRGFERDLVRSEDPEEMPKLPKDRVLVIEAAGCRAVPLILDAVEGSTDEQFRLACRVLLMEITSKARVKDGSGMTLCFATYMIEKADQYPEGPAEARKWWRQHLASQHPWWKPWPWACPAR